MLKSKDIVKSGKWFYDLSVFKSVAIIKQNWDYYFELGYSEGEPDLNSDGFVYYVVFDEPLDDGDYLSRSETILSLEEAISIAEKIVGKIYWNLE